MKDPIGVVVIVLDQTKKKILLGVRKNCYGAGAYGLPGGRLEFNEPFKECAKREFREELGIIVKFLKFIGVVRDFQVDHNFIHFSFVCEDFDGKVRLLEPEKCEDWQSFPLDNLPQNILPGDREAIDIFLKQDLPLRDYIK